MSSERAVFHPSDKEWPDDVLAGLRGRAPLYAEQSRRLGGSAWVSKAERTTGGIILTVELPLDLDPDDLRVHINAWSFGWATRRRTFWERVLPPLRRRRPSDSPVPLTMISAQVSWFRYGAERV